MKTSSPDPDPLQGLRTALARQAPASAAMLAKALDVSIPTVHRLLANMPGDELIVAGRARRTRYGLRRSLRGQLAQWPLYAVDEDGRAAQAGALSLVRPKGSWIAPQDAAWPVPEECRDGWWPGLPYLLYDMRPQGYMGRAFARLEHRSLGVSPDPREWGDDDILHVLLQRGWDASGNLIVGDEAYAQWQAWRRTLAPPLPDEGIAAAYAGLAEQAVTVGVPGSSAAGEFPKFAARRALAPGGAGDTAHVLVKFSGADDSASVRRWADLLVCEHLALETLSGLAGLDAARSRLLGDGGRTFLELERFDRHGDFGRSALCTLESLNDALLGMPAGDWPAVARGLQGQGWLDADDVARVARLWWFGRLIGNADMHAGNLSFRPSAKGLRLAPAYDMLPMMYAPLPGGEVPPRAFEPPLPLPAQREAWHQAFEAAMAFWRRAASDDRISEPLRWQFAQDADHLVAAGRHA